MLRMNPLEQKKHALLLHIVRFIMTVVDFFLAKQMRNAAMMITVEDDSGKNIATAI